METVIRIVNGTELILAQDKIFSMTVEKTMGADCEGERDINIPEKQVK